MQRFIRNVFCLLRPIQWSKNLFIFLPIFFGGRLFDVNSLIPAVISFISFSFVASAIYCFNDIHDVEYDRRHPTKKLRPIATGEISRTEAWVICIVAALTGFIVISCLDRAQVIKVLLIILVYFILNIFYCIKLKHYAIVDLFVIATGFVLRLFVGSYSSGIDLSHWIVILTFLLALFLAFAKRRDDVITYENTGIMQRRNVNRYNVDFMNQSLSIIAAVILVSYIMYCVSSDIVDRVGGSYVYLTSVFVLAGVIRYLQLSIVDLKSASPTHVLITDHFIQTCIACWIFSFLVLIYL